LLRERSVKLGIVVLLFVARGKRQLFAATRNRRDNVIEDRVDHEIKVFVYHMRRYQHSVHSRLWARQVAIVSSRYLVEHNVLNACVSEMHFYVLSIP
jgi:hypothetical protein